MIAKSTDYASYESSLPSTLPYLYQVNPVTGMVDKYHNPASSTYSLSSQWDPVTRESYLAKQERLNREYAERRPTSTAFAVPAQAAISPEDRREMLQNLYARGLGGSRIATRMQKQEVLRRAGLTEDNPYFRSLSPEDQAKFYQYINPKTMSLSGQLTGSFSRRYDGEKPVEQSRLAYTIGDREPISIDIPRARVTSRGVVLESEFDRIRRLYNVT